MKLKLILLLVSMVVLALLTYDVEAAPQPEFNMESVKKTTGKIVVSIYRYTQAH